MIFCNLIGNGLENGFARKVNKLSGVPVKFNVDSDALTYGGETAGVRVFFENGSVVVSDAPVGGGDGWNAFAMAGASDSFVFPEEVQGRRVKQNPLLWADVQETDENPVILVACKAIHLVNNISSYLKVLQVSDKVILAMLVSGAVGYETEEGEILYLSRCLEEGVSISNRATRKLTPATLDSMLMLEDNHGYKYNMDMVVSFCAYLQGTSVGIRPMKKDCVVIDPQAAERAAAVKKRAEDRKKAEEERKRAEEEEQKKRNEEQDAYLAAQRKALRQAEEAERARKKAEAKEKAAATRAAKAEANRQAREIKTPEGSARNAGAEFFLAMLGKS